MQNDTEAYAALDAIMEKRTANQRNAAIVEVARLRAVNAGLLAALKKIVADWDGEPEDMLDAIDAIAKAEGR